MSSKKRESSADLPAKPWWYQKGAASSYVIESGGRGMTAVGTLVINGVEYEVRDLVTSKPSQETDAEAVYRNTEYPKETP